MKALIIPCLNRVNCPGSDNPFANLTMEAPDSEIFIGVNFGPNLKPPIGWSWRNPRGFAFCGSNVSQTDANLCAEKRGVEDQVDQPPGGDGGDWRDPGGNPPTIYSSTAQVCFVNCPDGTPFGYQVIAGLFENIVQADADAEARSYACTLASVNKICFGSFTQSCCLGQPYESVMEITGRGPFTVTVIGGQPPPGLSLAPVSTPTSANGLELAGIPTVSGIYVFTLKATNPAGNFMVKTFTLPVLGISPKVLPDATLGALYSQQLSGDGGTVPFVFEIVEDSLPDGLSMGSTGLIAGTPTTAGSFDFTVQIAEASGRTCNTRYTLNVSPGGINFNKLAWTITTQDPGMPAGTASLPILAANTFRGIVIGAPGTFSNPILQFFGTFTYNGPAVEGTITVTAVRPGTGPNLSDIQISQDGNVLAINGIGPVFDTSGVGTFQVADTAGVDTTIRIDVFLVGADNNSGVDLMAVFTPAF